MYNLSIVLLWTSHVYDVEPCGHISSSVRMGKFMKSKKGLKLYNLLIHNFLFCLLLKMLGGVLSAEVQGREISQQVETSDCNGVIPLILSVHSNNDRTV